MDTFNLNGNSAAKIQIDLLLEIAAWQFVITKSIIEQKAKENNTSEKEEAQKIEEMKNSIKNSLFNQLYANDGPDIGSDILNN